MDAMTDAFPYTGWATPGEQYEIAEICNPQYVSQSLLTTPFDTAIKSPTTGRVFHVAKGWSNQAHACVGLPNDLALFQEATALPWGVSLLLGSALAALGMVAVKREPSWACV